MIDPFRKENGATRFVPESHKWDELPRDRLLNTQDPYAGEVLARGERGAMIVFNGAVWHGHTANSTSEARRSLQGYFVRRDARSGFDFPNRLKFEARSRLSPLARYLLALDREQHEAGTEENLDNRG